MAEHMKILLVEDEKRMAEALLELLRQEEYETDYSGDGVEALDLIYRNEFSMIILDVILPQINGFEIVKRMREADILTPVLMISANGEVDYKVTGLDSGADDYLSKPFESREFLARVRALTRRNSPQREDKLSFGDIELNKENFYLTCVSSKQSVRLSKKEFRLMELFLLNKKQLLTREQLVSKIWGYDCEAEYNNVEVYLSFVRKKLVFIEASTEIKSVRGIGYELREKHV